MNFHSVRAVARAVLIAALVSVTAAAAADERVLISYEATPSLVFDLPNLKTAGYADRAAFSAEVLEKIVPKIVASIGVDPAVIETEVTPGGYLLKTNASLQTEAALDDATADRLAAAFGYIFHQHSVLVSRLDDSSGSTGFVTVRFPKDTLDATVAQRFFEKADAVEKGLGGGYTAFGDEQIFLNVVDGNGKPYSGLDNAAFLDGLKRTAAAFGPPAPEVSDSGTAAARFIGNDWDKAPKGEDYLARLGGVGSPAVTGLDAVATEYAALVSASALHFGWN
ncbi:hypothetical protein [Mesorhizobium carmichaelinearum]|uniref:hypothetical protein n=1 Tax=Mesorhizobium carmichaelinearum TaxID=1208188 RepID=UPI001FCE98E5|nr:hypothetical protein [Mesorhizobium carmichaelinearum]